MPGRFDVLTDLLKRDRLGAAFGVLCAAFLGVAVIATTKPAGPAVSAGLPSPGRLSLDGDGLALAGHDPVAYHAERRARPGSPRWTARWGAARYRFVSETNRDSFLQSPARYAPQFGGHDALSVREGDLAPADPTVFRVAGGRLYLLRDWDAYAAWTADAPHNRRLAEMVWPKLAILAAR